MAQVGNSMQQRDRCLGTVMELHAMVVVAGKSAIAGMESGVWVLLGSRLLQRGTACSLECGEDDPMPSLP